MNEAELNDLGFSGGQIEAALALWERRWERPGIYSDDDMRLELNRLALRPHAYVHDELFGPLAQTMLADRP